MGAIKKGLSIACISAIMASGAKADMSSFISSALGGSFTSENAGYFKSQASGFVTGGSARFRWGGGETIQPFSVQAPKFNVGCNGIDMVLGGFSYLNFQYLVDKLKKIASAAPAFAFQIALSTLCKDCQTIMSELEDIANAINNMNFDTCQMTTNWSNKLGKVLSENITGGQQADWVSGFSETTKNAKEKISQFTQWVNGNSPTADQDNTAAKVLLEQFSLIKNATKKSNGFFKKAFGNDEYEHIIRGLVGDVVGYTEEGATVATGNGANAEPKIAVLRPEISAESFINVVWDNKEKKGGKNQVQYTKYNIQCDDGKCNDPAIGTTKATLMMNKSMRELMEAQFDEILTNITQNTPLTADNKSFIEGAPLPVADVLNLASTGKISFKTNTPISEYIALLTLKAYMDDLYFELNQTLAAYQNQSKKLDREDAQFMREIAVASMEFNNAVQGRLTQISEEIGINSGVTDQIKNMLMQGLRTNPLTNTGKN
ncbi:conjugal transfer protein TraG [Campylobacter sp. MIT 12-8780]|uniref:conjugal transfer protein TraH n=1 Tax=unclassified Campylobacter TaxID=2593542 RepID=UPI00115DC823|nr:MULTISPECIES: conjugal transfer protein TraH [unclassified Campylobacter]NDJ27689.1 conjugal transfer protein TraG [Campylobacter sp. MIT 19-121]TQR40853.1 conjugal transfer protein TraG [Campylobacter sp. MIT 12-8780]